jgi:hypothetical protein
MTSYTELSRDPLFVDGRHVANLVHLEGGNVKKKDAWRVRFIARGLEGSYAAATRGGALRLANADHPALTA